MEVKINKKHIENVCEDIERKKELINNKIKKLKKNKLEISNKIEIQSKELSKIKLPKRDIENRLTKELFELMKKEYSTAFLRDEEISYYIEYSNNLFYFMCKCEIKNSIPSLYFYYDYSNKPCVEDIYYTEKNIKKYFNKIKEKYDI